MISNLGPNAWEGKIDLKSAFRLPLLISIYLASISKANLISINVSQWVIVCSDLCSKIVRFFFPMDCYPGDGVKYCRSLFKRFYFCRRKFVFRLWTIDRIYWIEKKISVTFAENKTVGPTTVVKCLVFVIVTILMMIRIPQEKIDKLKLLLHPLLHKKTINVKQLESFTGLMTFVSKALSSARAFRTRF